MSESLLDKSLDEILGNSRPSRGGGSSSYPRRGRGGGRSNYRGGSSNRRGGISKRSYGNHQHRRGYGDSYVPREYQSLPREIEELSRGEPCLKVTHLNTEITEQDILALFDQIGEVSFCRLLIDTQGNSKGIAFVGYVDYQNDEAAITKFDGRRAAGEVITVREVNKPQQSPQERGPNPLTSRISSEPTGSSKKAPRPKKKTAEELDAELENYFNKDNEEIDSNNHDSNKEAGDPNPPFPAV